MSKPDFQNLPTRLGVYTLTRHLGEQGKTTLFRAKQSHVERGVLVEVLTGVVSHADVEQFLASVRARVAVHLPHVTQVYEAMAADETWYLTLAAPEGKSLTQLAAENKRLSPTQVCAIIEAAGKLYAETAKRNIAATGLYPHSIYLSGEQRVQFISPVISGEHTAESVAEQMNALAAALAPMMPQDGVPGRTRARTLLDWLQNGYEGERLEWLALADSAATVKEQLEPQLNRDNVAGLNGKTRGAIVRETMRNRRKFRKTLYMAGAALGLVIASAVVGSCMAPDEVEDLPANDGSTITCYQGSQVVKVAAHPVSIREYREFLLVFESENRLTRDQRRRLLEGVPQDGSGRRPADWEKQWAAANKGVEYEGKKLSHQSPVRGVSYWDALVYARYREAELPTARLLTAAKKHGNAAGSLCEWTTDICPATDFSGEGTLLLPAEADATPRIEPNRSARNTEYGFRIVYP